MILFYERKLLFHRFRVRREVHGITERDIQLQRLRRIQRLR